MFAKLLTSTSLQGTRRSPCLWETEKYNLNKLLICGEMIQRSQLLLPPPISGHNLLTMMGFYMILWHQHQWTRRKSSNEEIEDSSRDCGPTVETGSLCDQFTCNKKSIFTHLCRYFDVSLGVSLKMAGENRQFFNIKMLPNLFISDAGTLKCHVPRNWQRNHWQESDAVLCVPGLM